MAKKAVKSVGKKTGTKKVLRKKPRKPPRMLNRYECELIATRMTASGLYADRHRVATICTYAMKYGYEPAFATTCAFIIAFFENPPKHPMRLLLNEAQCRKLWSAMIEFGYPHLTFATVQAAALEVHKGVYNEADVIAVMTARQVDELQAEMDRRGM